MKFKNYQLIIDENRPLESDIIKVATLGPNQIKAGVNLFEVKKSIEYNRFLWLYCEYDNPSLYNPSVFNLETNEIEVNPKKSHQLEFRNQVFICYDIEKDILYCNQEDRKSFLKIYISDSLQKNVVIKNIYSSIEEFQTKIKTLCEMRFIQKENLMNL